MALRLGSFCTLALVVLLCASAPAVSQWSWPQPDFGENVAALADGTLFAWTGAPSDPENVTPAHVSRDDGRTWQPVSGLSSTNVTGMTVTDDLVVFFCNNTTINVSSDAGRTWTIVPTPEEWGDATPWTEPYSFSRPIVHKGRNQAPDEVWEYDPDIGRFLLVATMPAEWLGVLASRLVDGRLAVTPGSAVLQVYNGTEWDTPPVPTLPDGDTIVRSVIVQGHVIYESANNASWMLDGDTVRHIASSTIPGLSFQRVVFISDSVNCTTGGWFYPSDPVNGYPYAEALPERVQIATRYAVPVKGSVLMRSGAGLYRAARLSPFQLEEAWVSDTRGEQGASFGVAAPSDSVIVSTKVRPGRGFVVSRSFDGGVSYHSVAGDTIPTPTVIGADTDGTLWLIGKNGYNMVSTDEGATWTTQERLPFFGDPRHVSFLSDGSWRLIVDEFNGPQLWQGASRFAQARQVTACEKDTCLQMPDGTLYRAPYVRGEVHIERSGDNGATWERIYADTEPLPARVYLLHYVQVDPTTLVLAVVSPRDKGDRGHTLLYRIDHTTGTVVRQRVPFNDLIRCAVDVALDDDGRLIALFDDGAFVEFNTTGLAVRSYLPIGFNGTYRIPEFRRSRLMVTPRLLIGEHKGQFSRVRAVRGPGTTSVAEGVTTHSTPHVYPNPATSTLTVANCPPNSTVVLHDLLGRALSTTSAADGSCTMDITSLTAGSYLVTTTSADRFLQSIPVQILR